MTPTSRTLLFRADRTQNHAPVLARSVPKALLLAATLIFVLMESQAIAQSSHPMPDDGGQRSPVFSDPAQPNILTPAQSIDGIFEDMPSARQLIQVPSVLNAYEGEIRNFNYGKLEQDLSRRQANVREDTTEWSAFLSKQDERLADALRSQQEDAKLASFIGVLDFISSVATTIALEGLEEDVKTYFRRQEYHNAELKDEPLDDAQPQPRMLAELDSAPIELCETPDGPCTMVGVRSLVEESLQHNPAPTDEALLQEVDRFTNEVESALPPQGGATCVQSLENCFPAAPKGQLQWSGREGDIYGTPKLRPLEVPNPPRELDPGAIKPIYPILELLGSKGIAGFSKKFIGPPLSGAAAAVAKKGKIVVLGWRKGIQVKLSAIIVRLQLGKRANGPLVAAYEGMRNINKFPKLHASLRKLSHKLNKWSGSTYRNFAELVGGPAPRGILKIKIPKNLNQNDIIALARDAVCGGTKCTPLPGATRQQGLSLLYQLPRTNFIRRVRIERFVRGTRDSFKVNLEVLRVNTPLTSANATKLTRNRKSKLIANLHLIY